MTEFGVKSNYGFHVIKANKNTEVKKLFEKLILESIEINSITKINNNGTKKQK